ncbi:hypothetical protein IHP72_09305 [Bacillus pumilus]|uniref:hypothetical protein n=1 Tax=Bacillus pumilus TaxID=1408 RepID=UPI001B39ECCC|nr:hypothetical protein [Bacillus pumilus]MBQ4816433.1 hypothetical protein [Bacillus pumilus]
MKINSINKSVEGDKPLISIEQNDIQSVPKVFYKGEEIKGKVRVVYEWNTKSLNEMGSNVIELEFVDKDNKFANKVIGHKRGSAVME